MGCRERRWRRYEKGQMIYQAATIRRAGRPRRGMLEVQIPMSGDEQITIHRAEPGF
jgi:hypothetical protein